MSKQERLLILSVAGDLALRAAEKSSNPDHIGLVVKAGVKALLKARRQCITTSRS